MHHFFNRVKFLTLSTATMTIPSRHERALFETTRRVLAEAVNEGLAYAKLEDTTPGGPQMLCLQSIQRPQGPSLVKVAVKAGTPIEIRGERVLSAVRPDSLQPPVIVADTGDEELDPGLIFKSLSISLRDVASEGVLDEIGQELRNSADNQGEIATMTRYFSSH